MNSKMKLAFNNTKIVLTIFFQFIIYFSFSTALGQKSPNIILILVDDQGWSHTSVKMDKNNPDSKSDYIKTSNLEDLANNGMRFSRAYAASPVCAPSRYAIQTGKTPARIHYTSIIGSYEEDIDNNQMSIAQILKKANPKYKTAHFGKWHMKFNPNDFGYDESDGNTTNATGSYFIKDNSKKWTGIVSDDPKKIFSITKSANNFIDDQVKNNNPFFLQISHYANHDHLMAREKTLKKFQSLEKGKAKNSAMYAAMSFDLDEGIGLILNKVKELGIEDNTYIIYTSDNGGIPEMPPSRNQYSTSLNYPLQRGKWDLTEGGIRVPLIISGPGIVKNSQSNEAVVGYDFLPTILELSKYSEKIPYDIDGVSIVPALFNKGKIKRNKNGIIFHYPHYNHFGIGEPHSAIIKDGYKLIKLRASGKTFLYDLNNNLEKNDIKKTNLKLAEKLEMNLENYLKSVNAEKMAESKNWFRGNGVFSKKFPFNINQLNSKKNKSQKAVGVIDLSISEGFIKHNASGFSMDIETNNPQDSILKVLKPKLFRGQISELNGTSKLKRMKNFGSDIQFTVSTEYLFNLKKSKKKEINLDSIHNAFPENEDNWLLWKKTVSDSYQLLKKEGLSTKIQWNFWENPDFLDNRNYLNRDQFFEIYKKAFLHLKSLDKNALIVGPSLTKFDYQFLKEFLQFAKKNNVLPNFLSWNENIESHFPQQIPVHVNKINSFMAENKITEIPIQINEYVSPKRQTSVAQQIFYIKNLEKANVSKSARTFLSNSNNNTIDDFTTLNGLFTNNSLKPTAAFWVYYYYTQMSGILVNLNNNPTESILFDGIANVDNHQKKIKLLLGRTGNFFGRKIALKLTNIDTVKWLKDKRFLTISIKNIKNNSTDFLPEPKISFQKQIEILNNSIKIDLKDFKKQEGIYIEIE